MERGVRLSVCTARFAQRGCTDVCRMAGWVVMLRARRLCEVSEPGPRVWCMMETDRPAEAGITILPARLLVRADRSRPHPACRPAIFVAVFLDWSSDPASSTSQTHISFTKSLAFQLGPLELFYHQKGFENIGVPLSWTSVESYKRWGQEKSTFAIVTLRPPKVATCIDLASTRKLGPYSELLRT